MNGYLKSTSPEWRHIFKTSVKPNGSIPLKYLYDMYGEKYNLKPGKEFIDWLKNVKLKGSMDTWEIVDTDYKTTVAVDDIEDNKTTDSITNLVKKEMSVEDVVNLTFRKAQKILPNINDVTLLKYALQEARPRANKDSLCRLIEKRLKELKIAR